MTKTLILGAAMAVINLPLSAQFNANATHWNVPRVEVDSEDMDQAFGAHFTLMDMDGDRDLDLVDMHNDATGSVWDDGSTRYWNVYLNDGRVFDQNPTKWPVPDVESDGADMVFIGSQYYTLIDMDGDGDPDMVDTQNDATNEVWNNSANAIWKVYENTGTQFLRAAEDWVIPQIELDYKDLDRVAGAGYGLVDLNDDNRPDLVDARNHADDAIWDHATNPHWKVYLNHGSGFNQFFEEWTIPPLESDPKDMASIAGAHYSLLDINGDGIVDIVDTENDATSEVWSVGSRRLWKAYLNDKTSFSSSATDYDIPQMEPDNNDLAFIGSATYGLRDIDGDGDLDLIDSENDATGGIWRSGTTRYWKVYLNEGNNFSTSAQTWHIPSMEPSTSEMRTLSTENYTLLDIDGDTDMDLIDTENDATGVTWRNGSQRYWRVHENQAVIFSIAEEGASNKVLVYPNPSHGSVNLWLERPAEVNIRVLSLSGQQIFESGFAYREQFGLELNQEPGMYFLEVEYRNGQRVTHKLVKE